MVEEEITTTNQRKNGLLPCCNVPKSAIMIDHAFRTHDSLYNPFFQKDHVKIEIFESVLEMKNAFGSGCVKSDR